MTSPAELDALADALWSREEEVRVQSAQVSGQLDVWDVLQQVCPEHGRDCTSLLCAL